MKIVADENIPFVEEAFGNFGETKCLPSQHIDAETVQDADILLVRSVTRVDRDLLAGSSVTIVASATIGIDHVDTDYLQSRNIHFAYAPGSNANSVAEYVMAALLFFTGKKEFHLEHMTLGVVGVGNIGSKVVRMAEGLGMNVLQNDPPLERQTGDPRYLPIDALMDADIVTLHVPLTSQGQDATYHLFDENRIKKMKQGSVLINTSRGPVVSGKALKTDLEVGHLAGAALDVWENEPEIDIHLLETVDLGTSHIAGYSLDGKVNGTAMLYRAVCKFLKHDSIWDPTEVMPQPEIPFIEVDASRDKDEDELRKVVRQIYDIERDDVALRKISSLPESQRGSFFHRLRKEYPVRREFFNTVLDLSAVRESFGRKFAALGFRSSKPSLRES
jgi:erythronate-4-phosphate dehydrogenase